MTQSRPNYILELKDRTIELVYVGDESYRSPSGRFYYQEELDDLGATPVPQEEPVGVEYRLTFAKWGDPCKEVPLYFRSNEDAENYRRRCESIGPEWTDWDPKEGETYYRITVNGELLEASPAKWFDVTDLLISKRMGFAHPTKERAQEWLDRFGKAWGLK